MKKSVLSGLLLAAVMLLAGCGEKDKPESTVQKDPYSPEVSNELMGCKWVCERDHSDDDEWLAQITETIVFVDEQYAFYSRSYVGQHPSENNTSSGAMGYTFNGEYGTLNYAISEEDVIDTYFEMAEDRQSFTRYRKDGYVQVYVKVDEEPEPVELPGAPYDTLLVGENVHYIMSNTQWRCSYDTVLGSGESVHVEDVLEFKGDGTLLYSHSRTDADGNKLWEESGSGQYTHGYHQYGTTALAMASAPDEQLLGMFSRLGKEMDWRPTRHDRTYKYKKIE